MSDSAASWTVTHRAPLSLGFPRQEYCRGLLFPTTGDLPNPGIESSSLVSPVLAGEFLYHYHPLDNFQICTVSMQSLLGEIQTPDVILLGISLSCLRLALKSRNVYISSPSLFSVQ